MPGILCEHCTAACCRYIALPIDTPETRADFDDVRWFLMHEGVSVFVEDGDWYIAFETPCRYLQADHGCGIYATRPKICRGYSTGDCDYHSGDYGWEQHFTSAAHLDAYVRAKSGRNGRGRRAPSRVGRNGRNGGGR
jgi:Fe-S-cluster containining protein